MSLVLDMTPTAINRTAVFHIVMDTARAWKKHSCHYRYGKTYQDQLLETSEELSTVAPEIIELVLGDNGFINETRNPYSYGHRRPTDDRVLFFDPLYTLTDEIRPNDVVMVLDISPITNPEWHNDRVCQLYHTAYTRLALSKAHILSISRHTSMSLWGNFGINPDTITEIPLYLRKDVEPFSVDAKYRKKRLLFVGSLETRKNIIGLMLAFERSRLAREGYELSIVGGDGHGAAQIKQIAADISGVKLYGFVSNEKLQSLYRESVAFVYPSYLEGFGVPLLEAMSWGLPILTSTTGAPPEVVTEGAILVDPNDIEAISDGMRTLVGMKDAEHNHLAEVNRVHARLFSFQRYISTMENAIFPNGA